MAPFDRLNAVLKNRNGERTVIAPLYESVVTNYHHFIVVSSVNRRRLWRVTICLPAGMTKTRNCSLSVYCLTGIACAAVQLWYLSLYNASVERLLSLDDVEQLLNLTACSSRLFRMERSSRIVSYWYMPHLPKCDKVFAQIMLKISSEYV